MKLLITTTSPYARKARIVAREKSVSCEEVVAVPWNDAPEVVNSNPLRKVPVLIDGEDRLVDSRVICEYLDGVDGAPRFLPADGVGRARVQARAALVEGAMDACLTFAMAKRIAPSMGDEAWKSWLMGKTAKTIDYLEATAEQCHGGDDVDMADVALASFLSFLDFRSLMDWHREHPKLSGWLKVVNARPAFADTMPRE